MSRSAEKRALLGRRLFLWLKSAHRIKRGAACAAPILAKLMPKVRRGERQELVSSFRSVTAAMPATRTRPGARRMPIRSPGGDRRQRDRDGLGRLHRGDRVEHREDAAPARLGRQRTDAGAPTRSRKTGCALLVP